MKIDPKNIKITRAKIADAQEIRKLENKVWGEDVTNKYDEPMFVNFGYVFVAKDKNKVVGAIIAIATNADEVYGIDWVVDKNYRRFKVGERLFGALAKKVKGRDIVALVDVNNKASLTGSLKFGFKKVKLMKNTYGFKGRDYFYLRFKNKRK